MTPLSWCIVISTAANVSIAAMFGWFLLAQPDVHVRGNVYGSVHVDGGTIEVVQADDAIQKVEICEHVGRVNNCASLDAYTRFGIPSYGLSVVAAPN